MRSKAHLTHRRGCRDLVEPYSTIRSSFRRGSCLAIRPQPRETGLSVAKQEDVLNLENESENRNYSVGLQLLFYKEELMTI